MIRVTSIKVSYFIAAWVWILCLPCGSIAQNARIDVSIPQNAGSKIRLKCKSFLNLDSIIGVWDIDTSGYCKIIIVPDSTLLYSLYADDVRIHGFINLTSDDSLYFAGDTLSSIRLRFDRIGAHDEMKRTYKGFSSARYWEIVKDTSCHSFAAVEKYLDSSRTEWQKLREDMNRNFPGHLYFERYCQSMSTEWVKWKTIEYIWYREENLPDACKSYDDALLAELAPVPDLNLDPQSFVFPTLRFLEATARRQYTAAQNPQTNLLIPEQFELAMDLEFPIREIALFGLIRRASENLPLEETLVLAYRSLDTIARHSAEGRFVLAVRKLIEGLESRRPGQLAETFDFRDRNGVIHSLQDFFGKPILIHYWGTWCGPCLKQVPAVEQLKEQIAKTKDVIYIGIALEPAGAEEKWRSFLVENNLQGLECIAITPLSGYDSKSAFGVQFVDWVPAFILLDREGRLISAELHPPPNDELSRALEAAGQF